VPGTAEEGYLHCGPSGAGHFVKMVHNGIEYGLMAAYAEGLNILKHANAGKSHRETDAETTPLRNPENYQYDFNLADVTEVWRRGSVVASWLLDLTAIFSSRTANSRTLLRPRLRFRRRTLDDTCRHRIHCACARSDCFSIPEVYVARRRRFCRKSIVPRCAFSSAANIEKKSGH